MLTKYIAKDKLEVIFKELPDKVDVEELMYRLYLFQKIEDGERDVQEGRVLTHSEARERLSRKWQN